MTLSRFLSDQKLGHRNYVNLHLRCNHSGKFLMLLASVIVTFLTVPSSATPSITHDDCRIVVGVAKDVINSVGESKLSKEFKMSLKSFIMPNGILTCDGSKEITYANGKDIDAYQVILSSLESLKEPFHPIYLERLGVHLVKAQ